MEFLQTHDVARFGPLLAEADDPSADGVELVSLVDVVAFVAARRKWPHGKAAGHVVDALLASEPPAAVLLTRPGQAADLLAADYPLRAAAAAQKAGVGRVVQKRGFVSEWGGAAAQPQWKDEKTPARPAVTARMGPAGALECLRDATWQSGKDGMLWAVLAVGDKAASQRLAITLRRLAIVRIVAHALFQIDGAHSFYEIWDTPEAVAHPALSARHIAGPTTIDLDGGELEQAQEVSQLGASRQGPDLVDANALYARVKAHLPMQKNGRNWPDLPATLAELLRQYTERMALPGAETALAEENIGHLWGLTKNTVHAYLTQARKAGKAGAKRSGAA